jgi:hypothetical protein
MLFSDKRSERGGGMIDLMHLPDRWVLIFATNMTTSGDVTSKLTTRMYGTTGGSL